MTRLPTPGSDSGQWGTILNDFLAQSHTADGSLNPDSVGSTQLQDNSVGAAQLQTGSVITPALADGAVTNSKLDAPTQASLASADTAVQPDTVALENLTDVAGTTVAANGLALTKTGGAWGPSATAPLLAGKVIPAAALGCWGHSFMSGSTTAVAGSTTGVSDMVTLIASGLALPVDQNAISGASLYTAASSGDWADVLQGEPRNTAFEPLGGVWAVMYGINDAAYIGHTYAELVPFKSALRAVVTRLQASAAFEDSHASIVKTGTWTTNSATNRNSGGGYAYTNTATDYVTWTPPTGFPGGTLSVIFPAYGDGGSATWTAIVNGVTYTHNTADYALTGNNPTVGVLRIPNVKRNNGAITFTVSSVSGSGAARAMFDCVMWEPPESACGVVALIKHPKPLDYTSQSGAPAGPVTDAGVDIINQIIGEVASEIGSRVVTVDTSVMDSSATYFEAANVHPNAAGHAYIAAQTIAAIEAVVTVIPSPAKDVPPTDSFTSYTPVLDGTGVTQGDATVSGMYVQADGMTTFSAVITIGSTTVIGTSVRVSLPVNEKSGTLELGRLLVRVHRAGTGYYEMIGQLGVATGKVQLRLMPASPTSLLVSPSATTPLTWAAGDVLTVSGTYRPA